MCNERRRKKFKGFKVNKQFLEAIRERDITCVYCGKLFNENISTDRETFDHFNCNEPLSLDNTVRCCWSCNASKRNIPLEKIPEWITRKKLNPQKIVLELLNKKINKK